MEALKKKVMHELNMLEREEQARSGELTHEKLKLIKDLAKTYYYLCKINKDTEQEKRTMPASTMRNPIIDNNR